jgi:hypothetical protein
LELGLTSRVRVLAAITSLEGRFRLPDVGGFPSRIARNRNGPSCWDFIEGLSRAELVCRYFFYALVFLEKRLHGTRLSHAATSRNDSQPRPNPDIASALACLAIRVISHLVESAGVALRLDRMLRLRLRKVRGRKS